MTSTHVTLIAILIGASAPALGQTDGPSSSNIPYQGTLAKNGTPVDGNR